MNDVQQAFKKLSVYQPGVFPRESLQVLIDQQDEATPLLLDYLETVSVDVQAAVDNDQTGLMLFVLYLLAQFREPRAYRPLIKLLEQLDKTNDGFLGDLVTEGLSRIIASVCDGNITPIMELAENPKVDEFIRAAAFYSLSTLVCQNQLKPEMLKDYCRSMLEGELKYEGDYLPVSLTSICQMLGFSDLLPSIRSAYQRWPDMVDYIKLRHVEEQFASGTPDEHELSFHKDFVTDTIGSLESWASFQPEAAFEGFDDEDLSWLPPVDSLPGSFGRKKLLTQETFVREVPKIGRNDPCFCGSGNKFKKCCG